MCVNFFLFFCIVCLWDGFMFIYRFRFIFLTDSVRSRVEYETQFELVSFKLKKMLGAVNGCSSRI